MHRVSRVLLRKECRYKKKSRILDKNDKWKETRRESRFSVGIFVVYVVVCWCEPSREDDTLKQTRENENRVKTLPELSTQFIYVRKHIKVDKT